MRRAGRSAATVLDRLCKMVKPGMSTLEIDELGGELMGKWGSRAPARVIVLAIASFLLTPVFR